MQLEAAFFGSPWIGGNFWAAVRLELSGPRAFGPVADSTWQPGSLLVGNIFDREKNTFDPASGPCRILLIEKKGYCAGAW